MLQLIDKTSDTSSQALKYLASALLIGVGLLITADVVARGAFNIPLIGVAEAIANGVVVIAFLQLGYTVRVGGMLRSELVDNYLPESVAHILRISGLVLGAAFFGLIAFSSWEPMVRAIASGEFEGHASLQVPTWPLRGIIVVCSGFAALNYTLLALQAVTGRKPHSQEEV